MFGSRRLLCREWFFDNSAWQLFGRVPGEEIGRCVRRLLGHPRTFWAGTTVGAQQNGGRAADSVPT